MIFFLHLFSLILSSSSCSATKFVCHKITDGLKAQCPFYTNTTLIPSHQKSAAATITHFDLFNSDCSAHSQILVCSTFAPFCSHNISVHPCRQLCLFVKSSCIHLIILSKIQWPAGLNCSPLPSPPQICVSPALPSSTNSPSLKSTSWILLLSFSPSSPLPTSNINSASSHQSTTLKSSAHPSSQKMLVDLSVAFGGLVLVLFCIFVCYVCSRYFHHKAPPQRTTASVVFTTTELPTDLPPSTSLPPRKAPSTTALHHHHHHHLFLLNRETFTFMKELWQTEPWFDSIALFFLVLTYKFPAVNQWLIVFLFSFSLLRWISRLSWKFRNVPCSMFHVPCSMFLVLSTELH